jgi:TonB family protein
MLSGHRILHSCFYFAFLVCNSAYSQTHSSKTPFPDQFIIGRHSFFDFGPPFDFYEVFSIHSTEQGTAVERVTITPPGDACYQPASVRTATASMKKSIADLLGNTNPCTIPEKDLRREQKRCKHCAVFSGVNVTMQIKCGGNERRIRMDILDRDMFDPAPATPEHTSWTMNLLGKLDQALGNNVMDKPMFSVAETNILPASKLNSQRLDDLNNGTFDALFEHAPDKPSELMKEAQIAPARPRVELISSSPFSPLEPVLPIYPPIARAAHVEGQVTVKLDITPTGQTSNLSFTDGKVMLRNSVASAVSSWKFPVDAAGQHVEAVIQFDLNCPSAKP